MGSSYDTVPGSNQTDDPQVESDLGSPIKQERAYGTTSLQDVRDRVQAPGHTKAWAVLTTGAVEDATIKSVTPDEVKDVTINGKPMMDWWQNDSDVHQNDRVLECKLPNLSTYYFPESKVYLR